MRGREVLVVVLAQAVPERVRIRVVDSLAAHRHSRCIDSGERATQANHQHAGPPGTRVQRQRLSVPDGELLQRLRLIDLEAQGRCRARHRQHLQRDLADDAQRAERSGENARDVVAGDVLHHLAAERQQLAAAVQQARAEQVVANAADGGARRSGQACGDHAADGRAAAEMRRLERQALSLLSERRFELIERGAAARGHDELGRLVARNARQAGHVERLALRRFAVEALRAAAANVERRAALACVADASDQWSERSIDRRHGHQKRGMSANGSRPRRTCILPPSAQRCSVGIALPGLSSSLASKARLTACICSRSSLEN